MQCTSQSSDQVPSHIIYLKLGATGELMIRRVSFSSIPVQVSDGYLSICENVDMFLCQRRLLRKFFLSGSFPFCYILHTMQNMNLLMKCYLSIELIILCELIICIITVIHSDERFAY